MLHLVRAPTLVIVGERDWSVHPANSSTLAAAIQDATLLRIPGVAHIPYVEAPDVTVRAITEFLRG
ncbi:MAG: hypothetical protein HYX33_02225 [Actinobacteria bacterium]|nr:hypothetical protein [Actinomycetota bacterium]